MKDIDLVGKTVVIVGSAGLIGKRIASDIKGAGGDVFLVDVDEAALAKQAAELGVSMDSAALADITDAQSLQAAILKCESQYGGVDGAVNLAYPRNAAYGAHFFDVEYEDFAENVSLQLGGYFLVSQQFAKYALEKNREFSLVQFGSIYGVVAPKFDIYEGTKMSTPVEYAAVKAGIVHLTKYLTSYTQGSQFRVNCVSPGGILDNQPESFLEKYKSLSRSKGMLDAVDVSGAVLFLCSDMSRYICGQNIVVDDGFTI